MKLISLIALTMLTAAAHGYTLYEMTFDQKALQERVQAKFPFTKTIYTKKKHIELGQLVLTDPEVSLTEDSDRIGIKIHFVFTPHKLWKFQKKPIEGDAEGSGKIRYDAPTSSFFVDDATADDLDVDHLMGLGDRLLIWYINRKLPHWLDERGPLYKLEGNAVKSIGRSLLQEVRVRKGILVLKMGAFGDPSPESTLKEQPAQKVPGGNDDPGIELWQYGP